MFAWLGLLPRTERLASLKKISYFLARRAATVATVAAAAAAAVAVQRTRGDVERRREDEDEEEDEASRAAPRLSQRSRFAPPSE